MQTVESQSTSELPKDIVVKQGITENQIQELLGYSSFDQQVLSQTSDRKRFKDRAAYDEWLKKGRTVYTMADANGSLLGIIWYGAEPLPKDKELTVDFNTNDYGITFAIRIYGQARGRKLSNPFMKAAWEQYSRSEEFEQQSTKGIWLETNEGNIGAVSAYRRFGFQEASSPDEHNRILMIIPL